MSIYFCCMRTLIPVFRSAETCVASLVVGVSSRKWQNRANLRTITRYGGPKIPHGYISSISQYISLYISNTHRVGLQLTPLRFSICPCGGTIACDSGTLTLMDGCYNAVLCTNSDKTDPHLSSVIFLKPCLVWEFYQSRTVLQILEGSVLNFHP